MERRKEKRLKGTAQMVGSSNQSQRRGSLRVGEQLEEHCGWREDEKERERQRGGVQLEKHCGSELARKGKLSVG